MPDDVNQSHASHVQSVARALTLLETLAERNREMSLTELSQVLGWPKSTVYGLLSTLRDYHYIDQSPVSGHYQLGVRLFEMGNLVAHSWDIRAIAFPYMQRLNAELGEMIQLATEDRGQVLYLDKIDSTHMIRIVSNVGGRQPMHCTGLGKALLAYMPMAEVRSIIGRYGMLRMTSRTITSLPKLEEELHKIRQQGYALDDREVMEGLCCVAAPIFEREGSAKYAVSVSALYNNMQSGRLERTVQLVKSTAEEISRAMGFRG